MHGGLLLLVIISLAACALFATPVLIQPFPARAPWYESAASFPRAALLLVVIAAVLELYQRRKNQRSGQKVSGSEELDSSAAKRTLVLSALLLFIAYAAAVPLLGFLVSTLIFLLATGTMLRLPARQLLWVATPFAVGLWLIFSKILNIAFGHGWLI
jgi:putative tricarboxylic transport membrane protein